MYSAAMVRGSFASSVDGIFTASCIILMDAIWQTEAQSEACTWVFDEAYKGVVVGRQNNFLPIGSSVVALPLTATDCGPTFLCSIYGVCMKFCCRRSMSNSCKYVKIGFSFARESILPN